MKTIYSQKRIVRPNLNTVGACLLANINTQNPKFSKLLNMCTFIVTPTPDKI